MNQDQPLFLHTRKWNNWKGASFTRKVTFAGTVRDNTLQIAKAECSNGPFRKPDSFDKELGEKIAIGRATKKPLITIDLNHEDYKDRSITDIFKKVCVSLVKRANSPALV